MCCLERNGLFCCHVQADGRICGSLPRTIRYVLTKRRTSGSRQLTLGEVNSFLDRLANRYTCSEKLSDLWDGMFEQLSPMEHEWLARIILKTVSDMQRSNPGPRALQSLYARLSL